MRYHLAVATAIFLALPSLVEAQRIPTTTRRRPERPAPLSPQPAEVANAIAYQRSRLAVESYPLATYASAPPYASGGTQSGWMSFGAGTHADYRLVEHVNATLDLTSSFLGGPSITSTAEVGTRIHATPVDGRLYPYADFRVGYVSSINRNFVSALDGAAVTASPGGSAIQSSQGFGVIAGGGVEYSLTPSWSLLGGGALIESRLTGSDFSGSTFQKRAYNLTMVRMTIGLRYNAVHVVRALKQST